MKIIYTGKLEFEIQRTFTVMHGSHFKDKSTRNLERKLKFTEHLMIQGPLTAIPE